MFTAKLHFIHFFFLQSVENPASFQAEKINHLFNTFNIAAAAMLLLVCVLVTYISIKFRQKKDDNGEGLQTTGNRKLEALMIGVPTLILVYFFWQTVSVENAVAAPNHPTQQPDVIITGHQWWWEVEYPASKVITANEVHLPAGKHILMELRTADVIHDWWVPELGNKMDMIPNIKNYLQVNINKPGDFYGACSEFCGAQHAWMRIHVIAQSQNDFNKWLDSNSTNAKQPTDSVAIRGAYFFQTKTCASCHRIQGTDAVSNYGPDLTHVGSRQQLLTGMIDNNETELYKWINHPQQIKEDAHMPDFIFNKDSVQAIAHYLAQLK